MVCIQAAVLPAIPVLKLHGQVIVTNGGFKFHFLPLFMPIMALAMTKERCSREGFPVLPYCSDYMELCSVFLAGRCREGLKSVLKTLSWQMPKTEGWI